MVPEFKKSQDQPPRRQQRPKIDVRQALADSEMVLHKFVYFDKGKYPEKTERIPRIFVEAMTNPGETRLSAWHALYGASEYYEKHMANGLEKIVIEGLGDVPAALLSIAMQLSYQEHAGIVVTNKELSSGLMLDRPEIDALARRVAAKALDLAPDQVKQVDRKKTMEWVSRNVIEITHTPIIKMKTERVKCGGFSHEREVEMSVPESATVEEARKIREERIARTPEVAKALDDLFTKIESVRGEPLDKVEKDVVVAHVNINYIGRGDCKIPVTI